MYINVRNSHGKKTLTTILKRSAMAAGGTVMAPGDKLDSARDKLGIQGQGLMTARSQDVSLGLPSSDPSPSQSRPSTATSGENSSIDAIASFSMPPEAVNVLETVINMNKALEQQIDALRLRLTVESKNHETEKQKIHQVKEKEISKKDEELSDLMDSLVNRDARIGVLAKASCEKDVQILEKEKEIGDLKDLVQQTENYAEELQKKVTRLRGDKHKLESDGVYREQNDEIKKLKSELKLMRDKIQSIEGELSKAKLVIDQQSVKIKGLESEKGAISERFKEELERASRAMRSEVERMREVMKQQYIEMRNLREQNVEISSDVRDIKDILLKGTVRPEFKPKTLTEPIDVNSFKSPRAVQKSPNFGMRIPMTSRQVPTPKPGTTSSTSVRTSMPSMAAMNKVGTGQVRGPLGHGLPPISKHEERSTGKWVPAGGNISKQATVNARSAKSNNIKRK